MAKSDRYKPRTYVRITEFIQDGVAYKTTVSTDYEDAELDPSVSNPGYKRTIALGQSATSLRSGIKETLQASEWNTTSYYKAGPFNDPIVSRSRGTDAMPGPVHARYLSYDSSVASAASARFLARCADASHQFDGGQFFGEFMQTVRLVSSPLKGIVNLAKAHKSRVVGGLRGRTYASLNRKQRKNMQALVYDSYLEATYGIIPLMSDVDSALDTAIEAQRKVIRVPVSADYEVNTIGSDVNEMAIANENVSFADIFRKTTTNVSQSCKIKGAIVILNGSSPTENFLKNSGGGLDNFLPTVYNLIPFSFLLDYISNAGDIIQATSAYRLNHAWSNTTQKITVNSGSHLWSRPSGVPPLGSSNSFSVSGGDMSLRSERWKRTGGYPTIDLQAFKFELPSAHQLLNTAALIGSLHQSSNIVR